jgi:hypothetical protein
MCPVLPGDDENRHVHEPIELCELPDGIELVYPDDRDRRRTIPLKDAPPLDFGLGRTRLAVGSV